MKSFLSTKRRNTRQHPVTRSLRAVTRRRKKQRVAATAGHDDFEYDQHSGSRITRVLTIIFLIHVVAIGLIFVHQVHLKRNLPGLSGGSPAAESTGSATNRSAPGDAPRLSSGDQPYIVERGDNYARIAAAHDVDEADLRRANDNTEIRPGLLLQIPPRRITAAEPPEVAALRNPVAEPPAPSTPAANPATDGLVPANDPAHREPGAESSQPEIPRATPVATRHHIVQPGETIWRISRDYGADQDAILELNNITEPRRIQAGQKLKIP